MAVLVVEAYVQADVIIDTLAGVEIIVVVVSAVVITLELVVSISYFVYVLSDVVVDALTGVIMGFVSGIGVEVLADANSNVFASLMPVFEFAVPKPL